MAQISVSLHSQPLSVPTTQSARIEREEKEKLGERNCRIERHKGSK